MEIKVKAFGEFQTNCYILIDKNRSIIIDPGVGASEWVMQNAPKPMAILNTHGHFDHVWSNKELKRQFDIPICIHKDDSFMLETDPFDYGTPISVADIEFGGDEEINFGVFDIKFFHFPGHSPGTGVYVINDNIFSGDFVFDNSIGRADLPYSSPSNMKKSIKRFLELFKEENDMPIYPGHGSATTIKKAHKFLPSWLRYI